MIGGDFMNPEEFGNALRGMRKELGFTLDQLGEKAGFKKSYLSMLENGKTQGIPQPETLRKLANGLNVDYNALMLMAGYIDSKEFTKKKVYQSGMYEMQTKLDKIGRKMEENDIDGVEKLNQEIKDIRKETLANIEYLNKSNSTSNINETIDIHDLFKDDERLIYYNGKHLSGRDLEKIIKFIETFITNKEGD